MFGQTLFAATTFATIAGDVTVARSWRNECPNITDWKTVDKNVLPVKQCSHPVNNTN